jgi:hypothetical protein
MLSPFAEVAPRLFENGYSPLPIMPTRKAPGRYDGGQWWLMKDWTSYCRQRVPCAWVHAWAKYWPDAGVGVACGFGGLIAIDIDDESCLQRIVDLLPPSQVQKTGRKGVTLFFQGDVSQIPSRNYRASDGHGLVDLLAHGRQTVLPPTIHPDTGAPYYWATDDTLEDTRIEDLPAIPDDIAEQIGEALREFGYDPDIKMPAPRVPTAFAAVGGGGGGGVFFRQLNDDALANLDAWVPDLRLFKCRPHGGGYKAVATWRPSGSGRPIEKRGLNLSVSPKGIEDFGTGDKFTAINLVMKALGLDDSMLNDAVMWLGQHLGYDFGVKINLKNSKGRG